MINTCELSTMFALSTSQIVSFIMCSVRLIRVMLCCY